MIESRSLKRSFFAVLLFSLGFPALISFLYIELYYKHSVMDTFIEDRKHALSILGKAIAPNVWFYERAKAKIYLDSHMQNEDVLEVSILDKKSKTIFLQVSKAHEDCSAGKKIDLSQAIFYEGEELGTINSSVTTCHFEKNLEKNIVFLFVALATQFTISLGLLIWLLNVRVIKPARVLVSQVKMADMNQMFINIAHQWRQPLTELSNYILNLEMSLKLKKGLTPEFVQPLIKRSNHVIRHLSETIDTFLDMSRTSAEAEFFNVKDVLNDALLLLDQAIQSTKIETILDVNHEITITGQKNHVIQILFSVLNNSIEAHQINHTSSPEIHLKVFSKHKKCHIVIEDNAGGIKSKPIENIFEPHYSHGKKSGSGIGLYLSRAMIEKMGGGIQASNTRHGARFEISLPLFVQPETTSRR